MSKKKDEKGSDCLLQSGSTWKKWWDCVNYIRTVEEGIKVKETELKCMKKDLKEMKAKLPEVMAEHEEAVRLAKLYILKDGS